MALPAWNLQFETSAPFVPSLAIVYLTITPANVASLQVVADHLCEEGDPRGEFINLQLLHDRGGGDEASRKLEASLWRKYWTRIVRRQTSTAWEAVRAWRGAAARARLRGMATGLLRVPWLLRKRGSIQRSRRVTIEYLESILLKP